MAKCVMRKLYSITSYVCLRVCDLFLYARVNVSMHFETVLFFKGSLGIQFCIAMASCITPYELSGVTNNVALFCVLH